MPSNALRRTCVRSLIGLVRLALWPTAWRFQRALKHPDRAQARVLRAVVTELARTQYGQAHHVAADDGYSEFQSKLPIVSYEDLIPWIERQQRQENQILVSEKVQCYGKTSGSSGPAKYIPYTASVLRSFRITFRLWLYDLLSHGPKFMTGKLFFDAASFVGRQAVTDRGVRLGVESDLEFVPHWLRKLLRLFLVACPRDGRLKTSEVVSDSEAYKHVRALSMLAEEDLEVISIWSPSYLTVLVDYIQSHQDSLAEDWAAGRTVRGGIELRFQEPAPQRLAALRCNPIPWHHLWPSLKLISCWDDHHAGSAASHLRRTFPHVLFQGKGLFATETPMTFPVIRAKGCVPLVTEVFYEFEDEGG